MNAQLAGYLIDSYRRDILGESLEVKVPEADPKMIEEIKAAIARIDALGLGSYLVDRDHTSYQYRRSLVKLLKDLEGA